MRIGAFITITEPEKRGDLFKQCLKSAEGFCDVVEVIDGKETWPREFSWDTISWHFQKGYEAVQADWVFHLDTDFIFHEKDYRAIRRACEINNSQVALSFYKWQFILPDRYNLKSRLVLAVNKGLYGDRIRFDSGGDNCQPSLDGQYIDPNNIPEAGIEFYNYEKIIKTEAQIRDDVERMARAWQRYWGNNKLGTTKTAYDEWLGMMIGRFNKPQKDILLIHHPLVMQNTIKNLKPNQWGYNGFGRLEVNNYV